MTKRINISVPENKEAVLQQFDAVCKARGVTRSEAIMELIDDHLFHGAPPTDDVIPEWLT